LSIPDPAIPLASIDPSRSRLDATADQPHVIRTASPLVTADRLLFSREIEHRAQISELGAAQIGTCRRGLGLQRAAARVDLALPLGLAGRLSWSLSGHIVVSLLADSQEAASYRHPRLPSPHGEAI
jgi:hypothetical protein